MSPRSQKMLGEILIERNLLLPEQLEVALARQKGTGKRLGQVLAEMGFVSHDNVIKAFSDQTGVPHVWLRRGLIDPKIVRVLPREKAQAYSVIPMFKVRNVLTVAMADSSDLFALDDIASITGLKVQPAQGRKKDIEDAIKEYYSESLAPEDFLESFEESDLQVAETPHEDLRMVQEAAEGARTINLVNLLLLNAIKEGASDIHIEPDIRVTRVRYRIDGALQEVTTHRADRHPAIISRMKVMAKMDIAERRMPQDGRIRVVAEGKDVDLRVSTMPTVLGEKMVLRLLDKSRMNLDINEVGFHPDVLGKVKEMLKKPHGILLVTGPTGSGKTTTLYAGLSFISSIEKNIVTIEDPVEYQLPIINQVQVQVEQGLTFARTLRAVLRQDPDVVMVGEIRDRDTAEVAVQAALTGHLVLSTLHTNNSAGAVPRLVEMGVEPFLLSAALLGVAAQRLVRTICPKCVTPHFPPKELLDRIAWSGRNRSFVTGRGCEACFDSGLRGRLGILELLEVTGEIQDIIAKNPSVHAIIQCCQRSGMRTLKDEAFRMVEERRTSLEEVLRVVFVDEPSHIGATALGDS